LEEKAERDYYLFWKRKEERERERERERWKVPACCLQLLPVRKRNLAISSVSIFFSLVSFRRGDLGEGDSAAPHPHNVSLSPSSCI
jgi:hypothetical protein